MSHPSLCGVLPDKIVQFLAGFSPMAVLFRIFPPEFCREIEGLTRHDPRKRLLYGPRSQGLLDLLGALWVHPLGENRHHLPPQRFILSG